MVVRNKVGLHARPAAAFVKTAAGFTSHITVENLSRDTPAANARSILGVLTAAVRKDDTIRMIAEGEDEAAAIAALSELVETNFGEPE
jgi:phosphotransferase system HPr (HPr) family protein